MCTGLLSSTHQPPSSGTRAAGRAEAIVIVVDSSVWIEFFHGVSTPELERLDGLLGVTPIAIGDLILEEVVQGFRQEKDGATAQLRRRGSLQLLRRSPAATRRTCHCYSATGTFCRMWST